ncbi:hypothetical protein HMPREF1112_0580 [Streptococcus pseudopneumoniae SK674]|nr:hypothetical protein HMPREF1046_1322 [Streptococcus pseudopneumoniae ATCC BAA-960 = CCUG 49455]EID71481.1 hypothetical protein HMPREF1112_0580 [Streptococcus pseudopneumoniae SK674]
MVGVFWQQALYRASHQPSRPTAGLKIRKYRVENSNRFYLFVG